MHIQNCKLELLIKVVQVVSVPKGAQPVGFVNRHGEAVVLLVVDEDGAASKPLKFAITQGPGMLPEQGDARYIGTAEFRGGQVVAHAWLVS